MRVWKNARLELVSVGTVTVTTNAREEYEAVVVGTDPLTDLAVIKTELDQA